MTAVAKPSSQLFPSGVTPEAVISLLGTHSGFHHVLGRIVVGYMLNAFGTNEWRKVRQIDAGEAHDLSDNDLNFLIGLDPIDKTKGAWETHRLVWAPEMFKIMGARERVPRTLKTLTLGKSGVQYQKEVQALKQHENESVQGSSWLIYRVGVIARNKPVHEQAKMTKAHDYEELPDGVDVVTVISCLSAWTDECHLGNANGFEKAMTYTRVFQKVKYGKESYQVVIGRTSRTRGVDIDGSSFGFAHVYYGVVCLRKQGPSVIG